MIGSPSGQRASLLVRLCFVSCGFVLIALPAPFVIDAVRQVLVVNHGYGDMAAWNNSLLIRNAIWTVCLWGAPVAYLSALVAGLIGSRYVLLFRPLLFLAIGLLTAPFWMTVLLNVLSKVAPGSGDEGVIGMFFIASISILLPAGAGAMIAAGLARVVYKRSTHKPATAVPINDPAMP